MRRSRSYASYVIFATDASTRRPNSIWPGASRTADHEPVRVERRTPRVQSLASAATDHTLSSRRRAVARPEEVAELFLLERLGCRCAPSCVRLHMLLHEAAVR